MNLLATELASAQSMQESVEKITAVAADALGTSHVGIALLHRGGKTLRSVGATSVVVDEANHLQSRIGEGPSVDAAGEFGTVVSQEISQDDRWPTWSAHAASLGIGSALCSQLHVGNRRLGVLSIYAQEENSFTGAETELAQLLALNAALAIRRIEIIEGLTTALQSRTVIGQAQGVLMERYKIDAAAAFAVLRRYSQEQNVRVVDVASEILGPQDAVDD